MENKWECLNNSNGFLNLERMEVPGGWLIRTFGRDGVAICFYPDPAHVWQ